VALKKITIISIALNILFFLLAGYLVHARGGIRYVEGKISSLFVTAKPQTGFDPYYKTRVSIFKQKGTGSIVFLGDSLTDNNEWGEAFPDIKVFNRGIGSDTTVGVLNRLNQITDSKPSKVFLMIGINDFVRGSSKKNLLKNYTEIINRIKKDSPNTTVYIESILPINPKLTTVKVNNEDIISINKDLMDLAKTSGNKFIDLYSLFKDNTDQLDAKWTFDGIHLNGKAYTIWENELKKYLY
jgi:lysophospholipase L1-like esterase